MKNWFPLFEAMENFGHFEVFIDTHSTMIDEWRPKVLKTALFSNFSFQETYQKILCCVTAAKGQKTTNYVPPLTCANSGVSLE